MVDVWPGGLPQRFKYPTMRQETPDNRLRTEMDRGPAKIRPGSSAMPAPLSGVMAMTQSEWAALQTFGRVTLLQWSLPFMFPEQDDGGGGTLLCRFVKLPARDVLTKDAWSVSIDLEILP